MLKLNSIKISTRIGIAFALALPITFWALGSQTIEAWQQYRNADVVAKQNTAANALIAGVYEILIERQHVNNALQAEGPATPANLKSIAERRNASRSKIDAAYADLVEQDFPDKAAVVAEFKAARDKAELYRKNSDAAIKLVKADRDADVVKNSYAVLSAFVTTSQKLWNKVLRNTSQLDTELGRLANIRIMSWNMRDTAGRERATISAAMSAKAAIPADRVAFIQTIRAQVGQLWRLLQANLGAAEHPALTMGLQSINDGYFGKFQPLADTMRRASAEGAKYPMPLQDWVKASTPLLATILDVMQGANAASEARTAELQSSALWNLILNVGLLVLGLALTFGAMAFAVVTIARPMRELTAGMLELAGGNFDVVLAGVGRKDEIGDVAGAVETFKVKSIERARAEADAKAEQDRRAATERDAEAARVMNEFDAAVGGIVKAAMAGDFAQRVSLEGKEGVVLNLAGALNTMCENINAVMDDMNRMLSALAEGDLTTRIDADYQGAFGTLKENANATASPLTDTISQIRSAANEVASASAESRPARPTCRSAPKSRPPAWSRRRLRWRKSRRP